MRTCLLNLALLHPAGRLLGHTAGLLGLALAACSSPTTSSPSAPGAAAAPGARSAAPAQSRADSLGGLPGHPFGEPLRAFPSLVRVPDDPPGSQGGYQVYKYPSDSPLDKSWFGRHRRELYYVHYLFVDERFAGLRTAQQRPYDLLTQEAVYLLGQGYGSRVTWTGRNVVASWQPVTFFTGTSGQQLEILSQPVLAQLRHAEQQRVRAENGQ